MIEGLARIHYDDDKPFDYENYKQELQRRKYEEEHKKAVTKMKRNLKIATIQDYTDWVKGFLKSGGRFGGYTKKKFRSDFADDFRVVKKSTEIVGTHGASTLYIIVPAGVSVTIKDYGHGAVYLSNPYKIVGRGGVPCFAEMVPKNPWPANSSVIIDDTPANDLMLFWLEMGTGILTNRQIEFVFATVLDKYWKEVKKVYPSMSTYKNKQMVVTHVNILDGENINTKAQFLQKARKVLKKKGIRESAE